MNFFFRRVRNAVSTWWQVRYADGVGRLGVARDADARAYVLEMEVTAFAGRHHCLAVTVTPAQLAALAGEAERMLAADEGRPGWSPQEGGA